MDSYSYNGCNVKITRLVKLEGTWKGEAFVTTGLKSNITEDHKIVINVAATSEEMAYLMAARQCNSWIDENFPSR